MIRLTRLNGKEFYVNAELIKTIESAHTTVLCLNDGDKINVRETPQLVVEAVIEYRRKAYGARPVMSGEE
ncbi:MAG: endoflagellar protein [Chloroflexi bacterium]|nr:endoflagellar protein [Chloroflexota bacterium]